MKQLKYTSTYYCVGVFFMFTSIIYTQNNVSIQSILKSKDNKSNKIVKIEAYLDLAKDNDSLNYFYHKYAYWLSKINNVEKAIHYEMNALFLTKSKKIIDPIFLQNCQLNLGYFYKKNHEFLKSINSYSDVIAVNDTNKNAVKAYHNLGSIYLKIHDYYKARKYYQLEIAISKNKASYSSYTNLATTLSKIKTKKSILNGMKYAKIADSISKTAPAKHKYKIKLLLAELNNKYINLNINNSVKYYNEALTIVIKKKDSKRIGRTLIRIGNLYNTSNHKKSLNYINQSKKYFKITDSINQYQINSNYSLLFARKESYKKSIDYSHKSLAYLTGKDFDNLSVSQLKKIINSINYRFKKVILGSLPILAETYLKLYEKTKQPILLEKSILYFKLADYTLNLLRINSNEFKSRLFWRKMSTDIYGKAIRACYLSNNIENAFYFMEKNKALLLMEDIATQNYRQSLDIPKSILAEETQLKQHVFNIQNKIEAFKPFSKSKQDSLKKILLNFNRKLLIFQDSVYNGKQKLNKEPVISKIKNVQQNLKENEVFTEYHISIDDGYGIYTNNENGYIIFITKKNSYFFEIKNLKNLKKKVSSLIKLVKFPFKTKEDINKFNKISFELYTKLFPSQKIKNLLKNKKLIISPDSYLALLPFETLITNQNNENSYLIKDCNISYLYSYSFLKNNQKTKKPKIIQFLGFAPSTFKDEQLIPLHNSEKEISNLENYFNGTSYLNEKATKNTFIKESSKYSIIHLATHANAQDSISPWIAFNDEKITLQELYLTKNNASLVVLSGCNTTLGKEEVGEGVMSLARGFFYSGSQSVLSSLWNADNTSTPFIMNEFYKNLHNGQTKSKSLHNAKLTYLKNHSLSEMSPHYWASFILLGTDDTLVDTPYNYFNYLYLLLSLLIAHFGYKNFKK